MHGRGEIIRPVSGKGKGGCHGQPVVGRIGAEYFTTASDSSAPYRKRESLEKKEEEKKEREREKLSEFAISRSPFETTAAPKLPLFLLSSCIAFSFLLVLFYHGLYLPPNSIWSLATWLDLFFFRLILLNLSHIWWSLPRFSLSFFLFYYSILLLRYHSGTIPILFRYNSGTIPVQFRYNSDIIPVLLRYHSGTIPVPFRYNSGTIPILFRYHSDIIPVPFRYYSGIIPVLFQYYSGTTPVLF